MDRKSSRILAIRHLNICFFPSFFGYLGVEDGQLWFWIHPDSSAKTVQVTRARTKAIVMPAVAGAASVASVASAAESGLSPTH